MKFDLHSHSYYSDGSLSPSKLIELAAQSGVTHLALTDHDTVDGLAEARQASEQYSDITLVNGVEFSCTWDNQLIHIVGLNIEPNHSSIRDGVDQNKRRRWSRAEAMFEDFAQNDIDLREAVMTLVGERGVPTRPHFAQVLVDRGLAKDKKQAFKRFLVKGKPGYIPMHWATLQEVGDWITTAGGVAVLAHPNRYKYTRTKLSRLIKDMLEVGVTGMEVSTCSTDKQQSAMLGELATRFGLLASMGSDFHSPSQAWARLGSAEPLSKTLKPVWEQF
jgi:hypothetical protein